MAKLDPKPYPGNWSLNAKDDIDEYLKRTSKLLEAIPKEKIFSYPYADSQALYFIKSESPLVLQPIPYGDAWQLPAAMIRGLRLSDIKRQRNFRSIFGG